jgi:hypothetical protein
VLYCASASRLVGRFRTRVRLFSGQARAENILTDVLCVVIHKLQGLLHDVVLTFITVNCRVNLATLHFRQFLLSKSMRILIFTLVLDLINKFIAHEIVAFGHFDVFI